MSDRSRHSSLSQCPPGRITGPAGIAAAVALEVKHAELKKIALQMAGAEELPRSLALDMRAATIASVLLNGSKYAHGAHPVTTMMISVVRRVLGDPDTPETISTNTLELLRACAEAVDIEAAHTLARATLAALTGLDGGAGTPVRDGYILGSAFVLARQIARVVVLDRQVEPFVAPAPRGVQ